MQLFTESETAEIEETQVEQPVEQPAEQPASEPEPKTVVSDSDSSNNAQNDIEDNIIAESKKVIFAAENNTASLLYN